MMDLQLLPWINPSPLWGFLLSQKAKGCMQIAEIQKIENDKSTVDQGSVHCIYARKAFVHNAAENSMFQTTGTV